MSTATPHDPDQDEGGADPSDSGRTGARVSRRRFLGWSAAGGALAAAAAVGSSEFGDASSAATVSAPATAHRASRPKVGLPETTFSEAVMTDVDGVRLPTSPAIIAENARPGDAWWVTTPQQAGDIEGYADRVSAQVGDTVTLRVTTKATTFHLEAYRVGYYQGIGARQVFRSAEVPGQRQAAPALIPPTNTVTCEWAPSLTVTIDDTWPPGAYLLKLVGATGEQGFVPLCVRDDASRAAIVLMHAVTTWQAYNRWGGYSLYYGNPHATLTYTQDPAGGTYDDRARIVSFDRPYSHDWASGASDFVGNELPVIFDAERLGLDVTYWTDIDLHEQPQLLDQHKALFSLGHDEYWSAQMRTGVEGAVQRGCNVAFLGANACYRQIRLQPSPLGPDRYVVCYKSAAEDPMAATDPTLVTVNWEQSPVSNPESAFIGSMYQDIDADADLVIVDPTSWALAGTGLAAGQHLPHAVQGEFDRYEPASMAPTNVDVIAHSPIANRHGNYSDITWYTVPGGGGVFDTGNASWVGQLSDAPLIPSNVLESSTPGVTSQLLRIMMNLYSVLGSAPAGATHPSSGTWRSVYQ